MAKHGSSEVVVSIADAPGGVMRNITPYVTAIGAVGLESITVQTNPFGTTAETFSPTGFDRMADIPISGFYDDAALVGPAVVFGTPATWILDKAAGSVGRTLVITVATGKTFTVTVHLVKYEVMNKNGALTEYSALVRAATPGVWS